MPDFNTMLQNGLIKSATTNTRTLEEVQHHSELFHREFNRLANNISGINGDKSRTQPEKAVLFQKVKDKADDLLGDLIIKMGESIESHREGYDMESERILSGGDRLSRLHLATHLKDNKDKLHELLKEDVRYLQASTEFPSSYFGAPASSMTNAQQSAIHKHVPEMKALSDTIKVSGNHLRLMLKHMNTLTEGTQNLIDSEAIATRFDEGEL